MRLSCMPRGKHVFSLALALTICTLVQSQNTILSAKEKGIALLKKNITATGLNQALLNAYLVTDAYLDKRSGTFMVYLQQTQQGIPVYNKIGVYVFKNEMLVQKRPDFAGRLTQSTGNRTASYSISPAQAILLAANHLSIPVSQEPQLLRKDDLRKKFLFKTTGLRNDSTSAELVWLPLNDGKELKLSWNVRVASADGRQDWFVRVDAQTGEYLDKNSLIVSETAANDCAAVAPPRQQAANVFIPAPAAAGTDRFFAPPAVTSASYRVYPFPLESANFGSRALETDPWLKAGAGNNAATLGWHSDNTTDYTITKGNNVWAQEDMAGTGSTAGLTDNSTTPIPSLSFDRALDFSMNPSAGTNLRAGIDNLFYWNNLMHDISYQYGFDEAAGNFQATNLGRGGLGNDYVNAFAEDGAALNNADFGTPPDGESPRMRMFQWNRSVSQVFHVNSPAAIAGSYPVVESSINLNSQLGYTGPKTANLILLNDFSGMHLGCDLTQVSNTASLSGNIALIDRGTCSFAIKIKNAQNAGAIAVIIINNVTGPATGISGTDPSITIPTVMVSMSDGAILKANLTGLNGTLSASGVFTDGALDNAVMAHEYTHGISNRLTGGPANTGCLGNAEQMGEGWSDYMALMVTTNWATAAAGDGANSRTVGTYVVSQPTNGPGIRRYPYSTDMGINPWTYGMMAGSTLGEVHTIGEIWCATVWDMTWNIIQQEGIDPDLYRGIKGNNIALQLVMQGMKLQPCSPGFLDGRDAILKADSLLYNYAHKCAIWNAFARRGMGKSAVEGSSNSVTDQVEANDLPLGLGISKTANKAALVNGDNVTYTIKAQCDCGALSNVSIIDTLANSLSYVSSPGGTYTAPVVHFDNVSFAAGETKTFTVNTTVTGNYALPVTLIDDSRDPATYTWTTGSTVGANAWTESSTHTHSGTHAWFAVDNTPFSDFTLNSGDVLLDSIATLSFWHYFETEPSYDGGLVEISTDGGASWSDLGPYMTQNRYNSSFDPSTGAVGNRPCFTGSTGGAFIQTVVSLTGFAGKTARIRFRFSTDQFTGAEGWYIDDIVLKNEKGIANNAFAYNGASLLARNNTYALYAAVALPVHFNGFDVQKQNQSAQLHWKVSDELNVDKYAVERSADGRNFTNIGEVLHTAGAVNEKDYYYTDNQPLQGNNFYRIAEKDLDGKASLSIIKLLRFNTTDLAVRLMPVPAYNHTVQLEIETTIPGAFQASLLTTTGQVIKTYNVKTGINQLDLQNFARGIYYVKVQLSDGKVEVRKLVIQ